MIYLDLETTGLNPPKDEILQIGILSETGETLMNQYLKPVNNTLWPQAQAIHGIRPDQVAKCPYLEDITPQLKQICTDQDCIIYNAGYDTRFLPQSILQAFKSVQCAMLEFADLYGQWDDNRGAYKWQKLIIAANHVGHDWCDDNAHDAISDCRATKSVWEYILSKK